MGFLHNKIILVLSPQDWGTMFLSKHHYAVALAERGNTVYFLNPPGSGEARPSEIRIVGSGSHPSVFIVHHRLHFPYNLKFHWISLFHFFMKQHIRRLLKKIGTVDVIWSFDLGCIYPFRLFPEQALKIFHPVDEPLNKAAIDSATGCDIIFSVTGEILEKYKAEKAPKILVNHGLASHFAVSRDSYEAGVPLKAGFSGNLLRNDIDRDILLKIVRENPAVEFHLWGSYLPSQNNIGYASDETTREFIKTLQSLRNVYLHGAVSSATLAKSFSSVDVFLICYDIEKDQSKGTNYHKIMEYLSTGRVIVSNNVTSYEGSGLLEMLKDRKGNDELPALFKKVIENISFYNSAENRLKRMQYARENTYDKQLERISEALKNHFPEKG